MISYLAEKLFSNSLTQRSAALAFPGNLAKVARRKLIMVDAAAFLEALNSPPGNRLEALKGDLAGKHSIRINDQWRVVFRWTDAGPEDVEIVDHHQPDRPNVATE
jgi:toxin HigB-1